MINWQSIVTLQWNKDQKRAQVPNIPYGIWTMVTSVQCTTMVQYNTLAMQNLNMLLGQTGCVNPASDASRTNVQKY